MVVTPHLKSAMRHPAILLSLIVALTWQTSCINDCMTSLEYWPAACAIVVDAERQRVTPDWVRVRVGAGHETDAIQEEGFGGEQWCFGDEVGIYSFRAGWKGMVAIAEIEVEGQVGCSEGVSVTLQFLPEAP